MAVIGRVLLIPKGDYSGTTVYNALDWVRHNNMSWVCKVDGTVGVVPAENVPEWQVLAKDGSVSGAVDWSAVGNKPFDDIGDGLDVDGSNNLTLDTSYLVGSNISYDNTSSGLTASNTQDAIDELAGMTVDLSTDLLAGSNITLTTKPDGKVEIASTASSSGIDVYKTSPVSASQGATSVTISDAKITTTSVLDIYAQNTSGTDITYLTKTVTSGQIVLTFDALAEATSFIVVVM